MSFRTVQTVTQPTDRMVLVLFKASLNDAHLPYVVDVKRLHTVICYSMIIIIAIQLPTVLVKSDKN